MQFGGEADGLALVAVQAESAGDRLGASATVRDSASRRGSSAASATVSASLTWRAADMRPACFCAYIRWSAMRRASAGRRLAGQRDGAVRAADPEALALLGERSAGAVEESPASAPRGSKSTQNSSPPMRKTRARLPMYGAQVAAEAGEQGVAGGVAEGVVVVLEAVEVEQREDERALQLGVGERIVDLDGFKYYNDTFGHPAGDVLLSRLGANLRAYLGNRARVFRMGGDEFCALFEPRGADARELLDGAALALSEQGEGFWIGCSYGSVSLPRETTDAPEALRIADQRMYAQKHAGRMSAGRQVKEALTVALAVRDPRLEAEARMLADVAEAAARTLGLNR